MRRPVQFKLLRYALVPKAQLDLIGPQLPEPKGRVVEDIVSPDGPPAVFSYWGRQFAFVGFSYSLDRRFLVGTLAKRKTVDIGQLEERQVVEVSTDDWIPIWVVFDVSEQYIAVEINSRFGRLLHVAQVLEAAMAEVINVEYVHDVVISAVTDPRAFWEIVEEYPLIYRAAFQFVSPNFLDTPRRARDVLARWKDLYNQTVATIDLQNEDGELNVPRDDLGDAVEYVAAGEGTWTLEVAQTPMEPKRVFNSVDSTETFFVDIPRASRPLDELNEAPQKEQTLLEKLLDVLRRRDGA